MTVHEVRQRVEWSQDRANTIYMHVVSNSNMLDSYDIESLKVIVDYLTDVMCSNWTNQIL